MADVYQLYQLPKDAYPLPSIDRLDVGATYQRLMDRMF